MAESPKTVQAGCRLEDAATPQDIHVDANTDEANHAIGAFIEVRRQTAIGEFDQLVETLLE